MHLSLIAAHEYLHTKQKTISRNRGLGAIRSVQALQLLYPPGTKVGSAEERDQDTFTPRRVR